MSDVLGSSGQRAGLLFEDVEHWHGGMRELVDENGLEFSFDIVQDDTRQYGPRMVNDDELMVDAQRNP